MTYEEELTEDECRMVEYRLFEEYRARELARMAQQEQDAAHWMAVRAEHEKAETAASLKLLLQHLDRVLPPPAPSVLAIGEFDCLEISRAGDILGNAFSQFIALKGFAQAGRLPVGSAERYEAIMNTMVI